ncbi:malate dehydrogenase (quinone) [Synechococcus sp. CB0101]|uniref:malate dehydrogenase (quinone) n=1 Tax=Synechococcus sp. CB0101 TaxID=232348 RepID=UPI00020023E9|nr:malate dehydrogenase (quinone) [Synechococcus sp. CB0101]QCH15858.1 malate dehydrogenase (quinone) [Synechococcus sp. CB0101]
MTHRCDALLVGAGIMGATLARLLRQLDPSLEVMVLERLPGVAAESSAALNNAGTGHAANCELNYTPQAADGSVPIAKALAINGAFELSLQFWSALVEQGVLQDPAAFIRGVPHLSLVWGEQNVAFLRRRWEALNATPQFAGMQWSGDSAQLREWMPLVMEGRSLDQPLAATRVARGTDVNFGALTAALLQGVDMRLQHEVVGLERGGRGWLVEARTPSGAAQVFEAPFVFLGAGGGALPLLQRSGIPEARQYGAFPVSGQWLVCRNPEVIAGHNAKVYGKAAVGAPPMSVPHLDTRWIEGQRALLFGPYAGFSTRFLKQGSLWDLGRSVKPFNLLPSLQVGSQNFDLVRYLVGQVVQSQEQRLESLRQFLPQARGDDWELAVAGQRVQIIKQIDGRGTLQMGTEVVSSADGSLAALLGASPGASTAVKTMVDVLQRCWPERFNSSAWQARLRALIPSWGEDLAADPERLCGLRKRADAALQLKGS